nr:hypothetical protein [Tanacetum cinerariifolium]
MVKVGLICLAVAATKLSSTSYLPVEVVKRALFRSGMSASGTLSLLEVDGSDKGNGNDVVGNGIGNSGGVPIGDVLNHGARINVDGAVDLIRAIDALVQGSIIGGGGNGVNIGNGIRNGGNGYDVGKTGDSGGVDILAATRYPNGGGVAAVSPSSKGYVSSESLEVGMKLCRAGAEIVGASGCSSAGSTSSAGGRYSGYSGP